MANVPVLVAGFEVSMRSLRDVLRGVPVHRDWFKREHDELARAMANLAVTLLDAQPLLGRRRGVQVQKAA